MAYSTVPHTILMVRPHHFGYNHQTTDSNAFQNKGTPGDKVAEQARKEFDQVIELLSARQVKTLVIDDTEEPPKPDAVFPNNWITTHADGRVFLYPMMAANRRWERRADVVELLKNRFQVAEVIDLSHSEAEQKFLEGTGSIVFDHDYSAAFACRSARTNEELFLKLCATLNYKPVLFDAKDENDTAIYHTNVMMWIGSKMAGVCLDALGNDAEQEKVIDELNAGGHRIVALSHQQVRSFAGNMFEVKGKNGDPYLLMSQRAHQSLLPGQLREIKKHAEPLVVSINTIEDNGGGSIRCMVAGIHLPPR